MTTGDGVDVERAEMDEADRIADLWVDLAASQREHGSHIAAAANRNCAREAAARHVVTDSLLVARREEIVGFVSFSVETGAYEGDARRGVIENLYVVPDVRGEGIGTALLGVAESRLAERGCDVVALEVLARNDGARRFYEREGYGKHRIEMEKSL